MVTQSHDSCLFLSQRVKNKSDNLLRRQQTEIKKDPDTLIVSPEKISRQDAIMAKLQLLI